MLQPPQLYTVTDKLMGEKQSSLSISAAPILARASNTDEREGPLILFFLLVIFTHI